ncbi:VanZ family protein [Streptomyces sp. NPDC088785]|uniref:VanZ family protein n=1 Tax=Streptomyces sp. NPDC088785 TaxID=3365897 RepID=UPI0038278B30
MWRVVLYVTPLTAALSVAAAAALALVLARWRARAPQTARRAARALGLAWLTLVLAATLLPTQPLGSGGRSVFRTPGEGLWGPRPPFVDADERHLIVALQTANAAMFVPLGILTSASARRPSTPRATLLCAALSVSVELAQLVMAAGRVVDVDDVLFNTAGALLGAALLTTSNHLTGSLHTISGSRGGRGARRRPFRA